MAHQLNTWREYLVDLVLEDNGYTEILQEYQLGVCEASDSYTAYGLGDAITDTTNEAEVELSRASAIADAESMLKSHLQNEDIQFNNAVVNAVQYRLQSESAHFIYVVYVIDKTNINYPVVEVPVVEVPVVEEQKPKKSKKKNNMNAEFKLNNESHSHLKFKKCELGNTHVCVEGQSKWINVSKYKIQSPDESIVLEFNEKLKQLLIDIESEIVNDTIVNL